MQWEFFFHHRKSSIIERWMHSLNGHHGSDNCIPTAIPTWSLLLHSMQTNWIANELIFKGNSLTKFKGTEESKVYLRCLAEAMLAFCWWTWSIWFHIALVWRPPLSPVRLRCPRSASLAACKPWAPHSRYSRCCLGGRSKLFKKKSLLF